MVLYEMNGKKPIQEGMSFKQTMQILVKAPRPLVMKYFSSPDYTINFGSSSKGGSLGIKIERVGGYLLVRDLVDRMGKCEDVGLLEKGHVLHYVNDMPMTSWGIQSLDMLPFSYKKDDDELSENSDGESMSSGATTTTTEGEEEDVPQREGQFKILLHPELDVPFKSLLPFSDAVNFLRECKRPLKMRFGPSDPKSSLPWIDVCIWEEELGVVFEKEDQAASMNNLNLETMFSPLKIEGFRKVIGNAQATGKIRKGDILIKINDKIVVGMNVEQIMVILKTLTKEDEERKLTFRIPHNFNMTANEFAYLQNVVKNW